MKRRRRRAYVCMYVCMCVVVVVVAVCLSVHREVCIPSFFECSHPPMVGSTMMRKFYETVTVVAVKKKIAQDAVCIRVCA